MSTLEVYQILEKISMNQIVLHKNLKAATCRYLSLLLQAMLLNMTYMSYLHAADDESLALTATERVVQSNPSEVNSTVQSNKKISPPKKIASSGEEAIISKLEFKQANIVDVVRALADMSGLNIVATEDAAKKNVTVFLQNITVKNALDTIAKNSGLWYRQDKTSETYRVMSTEEYQRDMVVYREDTTKIFNLLHPNPTEVATVIRDVYGSRVIVSQLCDSGAVRKLGGIANAANNTTGSVRTTSSNRASANQNNRQQNANNRNNILGINGQSENLVNEKMSADQLQQLDEIVVTSNGNTIAAERLSKISSSEPSIYLSVNCEHNLIILRTSDNAAIKDIEHLIKEMDRPVPQVLLEMKILELTMGDSFEQLFDLNYQAGTTTKGPGVFSTAIPTLPIGTLSNQNNLTLGAGSLVYQFLSDRISAKIQLLETKNKVKTISSPVLLASNNRKSELFVGTQNLITTGFNPGTVVTPANGSPVTVAPTPITELQDVGPKLTITPKINADKTVTIEIDQAVTSIIRDLSQVLVPDATGNLTQQFVDGLNVATINGIVTAKDGLTVAIGGLIKNSDSKVDTRVPVFSSIPLLGELFKGKKDVSSRTEMVLLITPHIISTASESDDITRDVMEPMTEQEW
ncbi:type II secretion system protein GspD [Methylotenera sp. L2L1]|uniref:type II secretion system protein GspD n=1 Tax=Methylotenera sp. L2L1 TaxID=1502770 RepID=UPI000560EA7E|nr:hypothetical protein [Methylotenera sp. L2L1]